MYAEEHPDQAINPDVANLLDHVNLLVNEGALDPDRTQELGQFIRKACESVVVDAIEEYALSVGKLILEDINGRQV